MMINIKKLIKNEIEPFGSKFEEDLIKLEIKHFVGMD